MIKVGSKVQLIGLGDNDAHKGTFNIKDFTGTVTEIIKVSKSGIFSCTIDTIPNQEKGIYLNNFCFRTAKLKEIK